MRYEFDIEPGSVIQCRINGHRHGWNGLICDDASAWNCGAQQAFRDDNCSRGHPKCFHLHTFHPPNCHFTIDDKGAGWVLEPEPAAFDDQILLLSGSPFQEPRGIREGGGDSILFGAYRVRRTAKREYGYAWTLWDVFPHEDGWVRLDALRVRAPFARRLGGPYLKEVDADAVRRAFREAVEKAQNLNEGEYAAAERERLRHFHANLDAWLENAAALRQQARASNASRMVDVRRPFGTANLGKLADLMGEVRAPERPAAPPAPASPERPATPPVSAAAPAERSAPAAVEERPSTQHQPFIEKEAEERIAALYGARTLQQLRVGAMTKTLLVLVGAPGVGKSRLAASLLDDPQRERTCLVAVSSTWRGPEDLLGYVNPITGEFEPTAFTNFLRGADEAWRAGDLRPRVAVFEEFNLSPPEYWLSEILVRSQYDPERRSDRTIALGGMRVRGWGTSDPASVVLAPNVRFVATVNSDHTTRPFSPRVLDRAALVELRLSAKNAIAQTGVGLDDAQVRAIEDLDHCLEMAGGGFSLRTAQSLHACEISLEALGLDMWQAIDIVLAQEVLSKVRLLLGDPASQALLANLREWTDEHGRHLIGCAGMIADWEERLGSGRDVIQA